MEISHLRAAVMRLLFFCFERGAGSLSLAGSSQSYLRLGEESVFAVVPKLSYRYV